MRIRHTGIYVNDLELMKKFYCDHLNMEVALHTVEEGIYIDTLLGLEGNGASLEIYKLTAHQGGMIELLKYNKSDFTLRNKEMVWETGKMHIALSVYDVEQKYEELRQAGISFLSSPCVSPDGNAKVCFCKDPEGNYLELVEEVQQIDE